MSKGIRVRDQNGEIHYLTAIDQNGCDWTKDFSPRDSDGQLGQQFEYAEGALWASGDIEDIRWWQREIDAYDQELERLQRYGQGLSSLDELMEYLQESEVAGWHWNQDPVKWDEMPSFGGDAPAETMECWSWDEDRVLVGINAHDLQIMTRQEWDEFHKQMTIPF